MTFGTTLVVIKMSGMRIRPAVVSDEEFILGLAPRLVEFGTVPGREASQMVARDRDVLAKALADSALFVAEDDARGPVGFIHLTTAEDYYTDSSTGHIADIVVTPGEAGRGVGSALIAFAEDWTRKRGFTMLTLNVFSANRRARDLYARIGFQEEWIRCVKHFPRGAS